MAIDYSLITDSKAYKKGMRFGFISGAKISFFILLLVFLFIAFSFAFVWLLVLLVLFLVVKIPSFMGSHNDRQSILSKFAEQNSFSYTPSPFMQKVGENLPEVDLSLPFEGAMQTCAGHMKGNLAGLPFNYISATFEVTPSNMKRSSDNNTGSVFAIMSVELPIDMPTLLVDTKENNLFGVESSKAKITNVQKYNLEGNFPKHYSVYAEKDEQINVLSVLTPEVMEKLLEKKYFDIWISGNKLVLFTGLIDLFYATPEIFPTTEMLIKEIDKIARAVRQASYQSSNS